MLEIHGIADAEKQMVNPRQQKVFVEDGNNRVHIEVSDGGHVALTAEQARRIAGWLCDAAGRVEAGQLAKTDAG